MHGDMRFEPVTAFDILKRINGLNCENKIHINITKKEANFRE